MKKLCIVILAASFPALARAAGAPGQARPNTCYDCHSSIGDDTYAPPALAFAKDDVHARAGFVCSDCHGGDPTQDDEDKAHDRKKGWIGKPTPQQIPILCARCHSDAALMKKFNPSLRVDELAEYRTSVHGKRLFAGDTHVAQCASCHGAHGILPVKDTRSPVFPVNVAKTCARCHGDAALMAQYKIPSDIYTQYMKSVHAEAMYKKGDISAPTCNTCHGNHGATPPEVSSVANVCGTCHTVFADKFRASAHAKAFAQRGLPGCVTCHSNHDIAHPTEAFLGTGPEGRCATCHAPGDRCAVATVRIRHDILQLRREIEGAQQALDEAAQVGMEVSKDRFELTKAPEALTKARTDVHTLDEAVVRKDVDEGLAIARKAHAAGVKALSESRYRRRGMLVSLALILISIAVLIGRIRQTRP